MDIIPSNTDQEVPLTTEAWPSLPLEAWSDTYATLHMWTQIVGKIRLAQSPGSITGGTSRSTSRRAA